MRIAQKMNLLSNVIFWKFEFWYTFFKKFNLHLKFSIKFWPLKCRLKSSIQKVMRGMLKCLFCWNFSKIMRSMGERLTEREIQAMINEADRNGDGKIDIEEFVRMLLSSNWLLVPKYLSPLKTQDSTQYLIHHPPSITQNQHPQTLKKLTPTLLSHPTPILPLSKYPPPPISKRRYHQRHPQQSFYLGVTLTFRNPPVSPRGCPLMLIGWPPATLFLFDLLSQSRSVLTSSSSFVCLDRKPAELLPYSFGTLFSQSGQHPRHHYMRVSRWQCYYVLWWY